MVIPLVTKNFSVSVFVVVPSFASATMTVLPPAVRAGLAVIVVTLTAVCITVPFRYNFMAEVLFAMPVRLILSPTVLVNDSGCGIYNG